MKRREGDTIRIGGRLGRVYKDPHGDTVYEHRRGPGTSKHPMSKDTSGDKHNPGGFIDRIWGAPILGLIVFIGILLCVFPQPFIELFANILA